MDLREALNKWDSGIGGDPGGVLGAIVEAARRYDMLRAVPSDAAVCLRCPAWEVQWREFPSCAECGRPWQFVPSRTHTGSFLVPPDGMVEAAAKAIHDNDRGTRPTKDERWDQLGEIQEFYHLLARAALVAAARAGKEKEK